MHIRMHMTNHACPTEYVNTDSDRLSFSIDNSTTGAICNERSLFIGMFEKSVSLRRLHMVLKQKIKKLVL